MTPAAEATEARAFQERPTEIIVGDAFRFALAPLALAGVFGWLGWTGLGFAALGLAAFIGFFFRNPPRLIEGDECTVVAPADGRVVEAAEIEAPDGRKRVRIGIFLSIFNVHVNRCPVAGRVVDVQRGGTRFLAAFREQAAAHNVRCSLLLETARGERVRVTQITGLIARRIVCHPAVGEWIRRGDRYGLIRFGSRTDVELPPDAEILVRRGARVRGGSSAIARLRAEP